jgi:hypothetical protein
MQRQLDEAHDAVGRLLENSRRKHSRSRSRSLEQRRRHEQQQHRREEREQTGTGNGPRPGVRQAIAAGHRRAAAGQRGQYRQSPRPAAPVAATNMSPGYGERDRPNEPPPSGCVWAKGADGRWVAVEDASYRQ